MTAAEPSKLAFPAPDEIRETSEKAMNLWVGALSPLWVPFWAAASFGLGAWAVTRGLGQAGELVKDMPLAMQWPGFSKPLAVETAVVEPVVTVAETLEVVSSGVIETIETTAALVEDVMETAVQAAVETVVAPAETVSEAPEVLIDPVIEAPVVPAVAEAVAETPVVVAETADSVKDIIADAVKAADITPVEAPAVAIPAVEVPAITPTPKVKSAASPSALAKTLAVAKAPAVAPEKPVVKPSRSKKS